MERERDLERLLTFVDAVVAIAITLLVLPLAEIGAQARTGEVVALLGEHVADILGFVISFVVIARLWVGQHRIVTGLERQSNLVMWVLLAWAFTIVVLPFPTRLVAGTSDDSVVRLLYIGTMAVSSALLTALAAVIAGHRELRGDDRAPDIRTSALTTVAFVLALVISLALPATTYWPLLLLALVGPVVHFLPRRRSAD